MARRPVAMPDERGSSQAAAAARVTSLCVSFPVQRRCRRSVCELRFELVANNSPRYSLSLLWRSKSRRDSPAADEDLVYFSNLTR